MTVDELREDVPTTARAVREATVERARRIRGTAALLLMVYGGSLLVVTLHARAYHKVSPIDELQHFDYMVKASRGHIVRENERVGQTAMRAEACREADAPGFGGPPCDSRTFVPSDFRELGVNTASSQGPLYYAITGVVARGLVAARVTDDLFSAGRLAGFTWMGTALLVILAVLAEFRAPRVQKVAVALLFLSAPVVLHASATINPDGALAAAGGLVLLAVLRWERRALRWWWLAVVGFAVTALEPTTVLAIVLAGVYLLVRVVQNRVEIRESGRFPWDVLGALGALAGSVLAAYLVSVTIRRAIALDVEPVVLDRDTRFASAGLTLEQLAGQARALVTPFDSPYMPAFLRTVVNSLFVTLTGWLVLGSAIGAALMSRVRSRIGALGLAASIAMIAGGPLFVLHLSTSKSFYPIPPRYGLPLVPALLVLVAVALRKRVAAAAGVAYASVVSAYTLSLFVRA